VLKFLREQLAKLLEQRKTLAAERDTIVAEAEKRGQLTDADQTAFDEKRTAIAEIDKQIEEKRGRIVELEEDEKREQAAAKIHAEVGNTGQQRGTGGAVVTSEPQIYGKGSGNSYFLDLARAQVRGDAAALGRLQRHAKELEVELPAREQRRAQRAERQLDTIDGLKPEHRSSVFERGMEYRVNPNRTDGQGGYFVPPLWLVDQYIDLPRFDRVVANSVANFDLPAGTDSINLPKVSTGTATAVQTADAAGVQSTDLTDTFVNAPVRTVAGQQDVAMQLLDQSPVAFDEVLYRDLQADLNSKVDIQVVNGSGSSGQALGILNVSGINAITYTDASPTLPELWVPLLQSASQLAKNRKMPANAVFLTPSMWYWALSQLDTTNRPLIVPAAPIAFNPAALGNGDSAQGYAGMFSYGLPALMDGNIPSNLGGGTNETRIITARSSDLYLWEGAVRTRALQEVLSGTLQIRFQVWEYFAFMGNRRPESISVISGTGVIPTSGF
jgi:HK97 family phage major capsid protein